ncbi:MAG: glutamate formiminotransferase [Actinomycetota bacterium]|nr:glutamate formiminotransferase [Actinomycetota bacterium]
MNGAEGNTLLAVPNVSEGRDRRKIDAIAAAFDARLLDVHSDPDHNRSVFTLAGEPGALAEHVLAGAREAIAQVDLGAQRGEHPRVGAIDVAPIVYLDEATRGAACAEALVLGDMLGSELELPVFIYGELAQARTRGELRRGGPQELARRIESGELTADFGPQKMHATAGAVLVAARAPLIAFNLELATPATLEQARAIAALIREGGSEGLSGVRAIGVYLEAKGVAQVSTNVEEHRSTSLADVIAAVSRHAPVARAELVGLAPREAFEGFPDEVPIPGFDPSRDLIEHALANSPPVTRPGA